MGEPLSPFVTRDLSLAAYLMKVGGLKLDKGGRGDHGDFEFILQDPEGRAEALQVQWAQSCCREFEQQVMALKSLLRSQRGNGRRR
jgi:hypothetical protein